MTLKKPEYFEPRHLVAELLANRDKKGSVLVAGCSNHFYDIPGFEFSYCDKNKNISHPEGVSIKKCDLNRDWPYENSSFDIIVFTEVIEHLENPWHSMREIKRIAKPSGTAYVSFPDISCPRSKEMFSKTGRFYRFEDQEIGGDFLSIGHINPVVDWEFENICNTLNLTIVKKHEVNECLLYEIKVV